MTFIKITDSIGSIQSKVNAGLADLISERIKRRSSSIQAQCKDFAKNQILAQPEMQSLISGDLAGLFGLYAGTESGAVSDIANAVSESVTVTTPTVSKNLSGIGLSINFQPSSFTNILSLSSGHVSYEGGDLHWLDWLITLGNTIIVSNYSYSPQTGLGRSNAGIMSEGGSFRVPSEFSGTMDNNFITRALIGENQQQAISSIIMKSLS